MSSELAAEMGAQGLRQTLMRGEAGGCRLPRAGVGIWALFGSTRESWRVLEFWEDQCGRAEATAEQVYPGSFPDLPSAVPLPGRLGLGSGRGWHSSLLLCLLFITVSCLKPSLSGRLPTRAELPKDKMNVCRPQS